MSSLTPCEHLLDLLVELGAVGDDEDPRARPRCSRIHLASHTIVRLLPAALRVPDDPALAAATNSCAALTPKYWLCRHSFFMPASNTTKSWISSRNRVLAADLEQMRGPAGIGSEACSPSLPRQVVLLLRLDRAVAQALGVVAGHDPLHRREEGLDEDLLLVVEILADALGHRDRGALQLQHAERDAVDVQHDVRPLAVGLRVAASTATSSAMAKWLLSGFFQSMSQTVSLFSPASGLTFTP